jgi:hypothetical protein
MTDERLARRELDQRERDTIRAGRVALAKLTPRTASYQKTAAAVLLMLLGVTNERRRLLGLEALALEQVRFPAGLGVKLTGRTLPELLGPAIAEARQEELARAAALAADAAALPLPPEEDRAPEGLSRTAQGRPQEDRAPEGLRP